MPATLTPPTMHAASFLRESPAVEVRVLDELQPGQSETCYHCNKPLRPGDPLCVRVEDGAEIPESREWVHEHCKSARLGFAGRWNDRCERDMAALRRHHADMKIAAFERAYGEE